MELGEPHILFRIINGISHFRLSAIAVTEYPFSHMTIGDTLLLHGMVSSYLLPLKLVSGQFRKNMVFRGGELSHLAYIRIKQILLI